VSINPFDNDDGSSFVLVDDEEQHGLWPAASMFQPASGAGCVTGLQRTELADIRPKSLRQRLAEDRGLTG
jgi:uncharacterized protein YbdZ (MbtH family)